MKRWVIVIGPLLAVMVGVTMYGAGLSANSAGAAAVTVLCALWWIFEPIPIPVTSLVPLGIFPLVGILSPKQVAEAYGNEIILLMLGGLLLSTAMERSGAHRRLALYMVTLFGAASGKRLVFGFMVASALLSMWISNTATALMLLPIVMAIVDQADDAELTVPLLLGVAYSASIGGVGTPIGTPPNLVFLRVYADSFGTAPTFLDWMSWSLPIVVVMGPIAGLWITRNLRRAKPIQLPSAGAWRTEEIRTLAVFAVTAILWMTRKEPFGGWSTWVGLPQANDASVAILAVIAMFLIPNGKGEKLLDWQAAVKIPWGLLILYAGGICIARAFMVTGLSDSLGASLGSLGSLPTPLLIASTCLLVTFLTEVTSNTATTTLLMPILAAASVAAHIEPRLIMVPATISASFAFMLPVATPTNAIVFGSERLSIKTMAREGLILNLIGVLVVSSLGYWLFS